MWTSRWGEWATLLKSSFTLPHSLVDDTNGVKRNISLMVLEMGIFLTTISNKPMKTKENVSFSSFVLFEQTENLIKNVFIYSFFELGQTWQKRYLTWNMTQPACRRLIEFFFFFKENNLLFLFSARNIGHRLKQSRPPGSINWMVYFTSRLILNEQNKERDKLGWFLPVLGPDCQRWCWIETKLLPVTHRKKTHTHKLI